MCTTRLHSRLSSSRSASPWTAGPLRVLTEGIARGMSVLDAGHKKWNSPNGWTGRPEVHVALAVQEEPVVAMFITTYACVTSQHCAKILMKACNCSVCMHSAWIPSTSDGETQALSSRTSVRVLSSG